VTFRFVAQCLNQPTNPPLEMEYPSELSGNIFTVPLFRCISESFLHAKKWSVIHCCMACQRRLQPQEYAPPQHTAVGGDADRSRKIQLNPACTVRQRKTYVCHLIQRHISELNEVDCNQPWHRKKLRKNVICNISNDQIGKTKV
jgi:hypothetical protein